MPVAVCSTPIGLVSASLWLAVLNDLAEGFEAVAGDRHQQRQREPTRPHPTLDC